MNRFFPAYARTLFLAFTLSLLPATIAYADFPDASIKLGWNMASFSTRWEPKLYAGALIAGELYGSSHEHLPGKPVFGAGVECMALFESREFYDIYTFIPLYGTMRVTLHERRGLPASLVFKLGYNWLTGKEDQHAFSLSPYNRIEYHGGVYYSIGIDRQMSEHLVGGIHVAEHQGTLKYIWDYGASPSERHIKYWRASVVFSYLFR